ncbi:MAG: Hsp20/alpha crystallin family protein [Thermodesulfobacteriota bacterium]
MAKTRKQLDLDLAELERHMGRMFRNLSLPSMTPFLATRGWCPPVDVYESEREVLVYVDGAGIDPAHLTVVAEPTTVTIAGLRQRPLIDNVSRIHQLEIEHGRFQRTINLPMPVDVQHTSSCYRHGFLEIRLPKLRPVGRVEIKVS